MESVQNDMCLNENIVNVCLYKIKSTAFSGLNRKMLCFFYKINTQVHINSTKNIFTREMVK